jgi:enolase
VAEARIGELLGWEALDSRGTPTLGCLVRLEDGAEGRTVVPSGASTGSHDARERRDGGARWDGLGVGDSVRALRDQVGPALRGRPVAEADAVLRELDPSPDLATLGVHAALGVSVAARLAQASSQGVPLHQLLSGGAAPLLPLPMVNIVSGGAHAGGAVDVQDVLVVPLGAHDVTEAIEWSWRVRRRAAELAADRGLLTSLVADEGGLGLQLPSTTAVLELVTAAIERSGLRPGVDAGIAIDVAANQLWDGASYLLRAEDRRLDTAEMVQEVAGWVRRFPIVSVEDLLHDQDWEGWAEATKVLADIQVLGDDLFATSSARVVDAAQDGVANSVLVKPNQRGTLAAAEETVRRGHELGYACVVSARSGDTEDDWLTDLAVGWRTGQIKVGSTTRSERTAKWNRLLQIAAQAGDTAEFAGHNTLAGR